MRGKLKRWAGRASEIIMAPLTMSELSEKKCKPCEGGVRPLARGEARRQISALEGWTLAPDGKSISRDLLMGDFAAAVELINAIASAAETDGHHPDLHLTGYRKLRVELTTHAIGGLSENDFILAAKIQKLPKTLKTA